MPLDVCPRDKKPCCKPARRSPSAPTSAGEPLTATARRTGGPRYAPATCAPSDPHARPRLHHLGLRSTRAPPHHEVHHETRTEATRATRTPSPALCARRPICRRAGRTSSSVRRGRRTHHPGAREGGAAQTSPSATSRLGRLRRTLGAFALVPLARHHEPRPLRSVSLLEPHDARRRAVGVHPEAAGAAAACDNELAAGGARRLLLRDAAPAR